MTALWLGFHLRSGRSTARLLARLGAVIIMGLAISGMHYVGMLVSSFAANAWCRSGAALNNQRLAIMPAGSSEPTPTRRAIIALAHSLKMKVIAEGVEQDEQLSQLKSLGCDQCRASFSAFPHLPPTSRH